MFQPNVVLLMPRDGSRIQPEMIRAGEWVRLAHAGLPENIQAHFVGFRIEEVYEASDGTVVAPGSMVGVMMEYQTCFYLDPPENLTEEDQVVWQTTSHFLMSWGQFTFEERQDEIIAELKTKIVKKYAEHVRELRNELIEAIHEVQQHLNVAEALEVSLKHGS